MANLESISHRCYLREVAFEWGVTSETIYLPLETTSWVVSRVGPGQAMRGHHTDYGQRKKENIADSNSLAVTFSTPPHLTARRAVRAP